MLNPEKWQAVFDGDGKIPGFRKALKLVILGVSNFFVLYTLLAFDFAVCTYKKVLLSLPRISSEVIYSRCLVLYIFFLKCISFWASNVFCIKV